MVKCSPQNSRGTTSQQRFSPPHDQQAHGLPQDLHGSDEKSADLPAATGTKPGKQAQQMPLDECACPTPSLLARSGVPLRHVDPFPQTNSRAVEGPGAGGCTEGDRSAPPIHPEDPALPEREAGQPRRTDDSQPVPRGRRRRLDRGWRDQRSKT